MMNLRSTFFNKGLLLAALVSLVACQGSAPPTPPTSTANPCRAEADASGYGLMQVAKPGFEEDIKPILTSTQTGKVYKCTTCHQPYLDIAVVGKQSEVDAIVAALESAYMPLNGDAVPAADIKLFRDWAAAGFPAKRPAPDATDPTPNPTTSPNPTSPSNDLGRFGEGGDPWGSPGSGDDVTPVDEGDNCE